METTAGAAIIGLVNGFTLLKDKNYWGFGFFILALVTGMGMGVAHMLGLAGIEQGLLVGLASSGVYKVGQILSNK